MIITKIQCFLVYSYFFTAPFGNVFLPAIFKSEVRIFHLLLPLFPIFYTKITKTDFYNLIIFAPFLLYCIFSIYITALIPREDGNLVLMKGVLFIMHALFIFGASITFTKDPQLLIKRYCQAMTLIILFGFVLFIGYYTGAFSLKNLSLFCIEVQHAYGLLRFSPGTYANEFGTISSFFLLLLIVSFSIRRSIVKFLLIILTLTSLILSTTRSAYISFFAASIFLFIFKKETRKILWFIYATIAVISVVLTSINFHFNYIDLIKQSFNFDSTHGSLWVRFTSWDLCLKDLESYSLLGTGFGTKYNTHNVYIELFTELGTVGVFLLLICAVGSIVKNWMGIKRFLKEDRSSFPYYATIFSVFHVLFFALSNHNLNHHLTWISIFLLSKALKNKPLNVSIQREPTI